MEKKFENSSFIKKIGYDEDKKTLTVSFVNGHTQDYENVPLKVANDFYETKSAGKFFHNEIKGKYE